MLDAVLKRGLSKLRLLGVLEFGLGSGSLGLSLARAQIIHAHFSSRLEYPGFLAGMTGLEKLSDILGTSKNLIFSRAQ